VPAVKGRYWADFTPAPAENADHYWLGRPYPGDAGNQFATPLYQFGTTGGGRYLIHHGLDLGNPYGTSLVAAANGEIVFAGWDNEQVLGPYPNFYGQAVVIRLDQRLSTPNGDKDVFILYGHMSSVAVSAGQRVEIGDFLGSVGMTGVALGPHLHLEVRVGNNDYISTVNPWLWMRPFSGMGTLAVRVLAADGSTWQGAKLSLIQLASSGSRWLRTITTYLDEELIGPDPAWGENGVMGDLPVGEYLVVGKINGERVEARATIRSGQTTFIEIRTQSQ
jgi:murein DD-endopeptidase MepM/ murein hydrolase activator NlpD